jgi:hypothetical protein
MFIFKQMLFSKLQNFSSKTKQLPGGYKNTAPIVVQTTTSPPPAPGITRAD